MTLPLLSNAEKTCLLKLAEIFEKGELWYNVDSAGKIEALGLSQQNLIPVLTVMEQNGIIDQVGHVTTQRFYFFCITAKAVEASREMQKAEAAQKDLVEEIKMTVRQHHVLAWVLISFFVVVGLVTFLNQCIELLKKLGWMN